MAAVLAAVTSLRAPLPSGLRFSSRGCVRRALMQYVIMPTFSLYADVEEPTGLREARRLLARVSMGGEPQSRKGSGLVRRLERDRTAHGSCIRLRVARKLAASALALDCGSMAARLHVPSATSCQPDDASRA